MLMEYSAKPIVVHIGKHDEPPETVDVNNMDGLRAAAREAKDWYATRDLEIARLQESWRKKRRGIENSGA